MPSSLTNQYSVILPSMLLRGENENLSLSADVLHRTSNLPISRCCFADDGKEMDKSEKRTCKVCKAIVFSH